eukprot:1579244-Ditylum_brightwellii.AAC.1
MFIIAIIGKKNQTQSGGADPTNDYCKNSDAQFASGVSETRKQKPSAMLHDPDETGITSHTKKKAWPQKQSTAQKMDVPASAATKVTAFNSATIEKVDVTSTAAATKVAASKSTKVLTTYAVVLSGTASPQTTQVVTNSTKITPSTVRKKAATASTVTTTPYVASISGTNHSSAANIVYIVKSMAKKKTPKLDLPTKDVGCVK